MTVMGVTPILAARTHANMALFVVLNFTEENLPRPSPSPPRLPRLQGLRGRDAPIPLPPACTENPAAPGSAGALAKSACVEAVHHLGGASGFVRPALAGADAPAASGIFEAAPPALAGCRRQPKFRRSEFGAPPEPACETILAA